MLLEKSGTLLDVLILRLIFLPFPKMLDPYGLKSVSHRQRVRRGKNKNMRRKCYGSLLQNSGQRRKKLIFI